MSEDTKVMGWGTIIGSMIVVGLVVGVTLGALRGFLGTKWLGGGAGVGAAMGVTGALLMTRRNAALAARDKK